MINFFKSAALTVLFLLTASNFSLGLDPPHNSINGYGCDSCHDVTSSNPKLMPENISAGPTIDETLFNNMCWSCHNPVGDAPSVEVKTHSSLTSDDSHGQWTVECWVCHSLHNQQQEDQTPPGYGKLIRSGIDLSNITYADATPPKNGWKSVVFAGPDSFTDTDGSGDATGICQVCHTETSAWHNDGTLAGVGAHLGMTGSGCMNCHSHQEGFKAVYECVDCHQDSISNRAAIGAQFSGNSHHIQGTPLTSQHCYQCHWEANSNGEVTSYHGAYPDSTVDLVIYGAGARPTDDASPGVILSYTADGTRSEIESLNTHCLGCHDDDTRGIDIFGDGKSPDHYAWDGTSIEARYAQTGTARWGKYYNSGVNQNAINAAEKDITKAYSAHGNAENNYGGGFSTVTSCFGPSITDQTCPDLGGTWNTANNQCDAVSLSQCTQSYCEDLAQQACENAAGTWGTNSSICKNISQYTCATGYCDMEDPNYNDYHDWLCNDRGGTYRQGANGWICTDISAGSCSSYTWVSMVGVGSWHVSDSEYMQGIDYALTPTRGGGSAANVACFDCHNSHGSSVVGSSEEEKTTSYVSDTASGGILKDTSAGFGGYSVSYKPEEGGSDANKNKHKAGAALCFNCHLTADTEAAGQPWSYDATFGANAPVIGYYDSEYLAPGEAAPQKLFPYKALSINAGGHFDASKPLTTTPMHDINGICTPCHDPHGVSPTHVGSCDPPNSSYVTRPDCEDASGSWTVRQDYGIPLLKGTWLTSPYREDAAPAATNLTTGFSGQTVRSNPGYHIDQNTFADWGFSSTAGISENANVFAGLCLQCHLQGEINPNTDNSWNTMDRIHNTVKDWDDNDGVESFETKHMFSCSKCHTPHNGSALPRLMITNCLNFQHRGRAGSGGSPHSGNYSNDYDGDGGGGAGSGSGKYPEGGSGSGNGDFGPATFKYGFGGSALGVACHDSAGSGSWPNNQLWNQVTPWSDMAPGLTSPTATGITPTTATLGAEVLTDTGWNIIERGTVWGTAVNPTGNAEPEGGTTTGVFNHERSSLPPATKIYYRGYATNNNGIGYSPGGSFYTEPEFQASGVNFTTITSSSMTVNWTRNVSGNGVIVLMKENTQVDAEPQDGTYTGYNGNSSFGSGTEIGTGNYVIFKGDGTSVNVTDLYPGTPYHVAVYEYAGTIDTAGVNQGTNYKTPPVKNSTTTITAPPVLTSPTATSITSDSADLGANVVSAGGLPISERGTVWGTAANPEFPADNAASTSGTTGIFGHNRSGLDPGTRIFYRGYAINSDGTGYSPEGSFYTEPNAQVSGVSFTPASATSATVTWTRGDGDGVIVLMKMLGAVDSDPGDGNYTGYTANTIFGAGTQVGSGNYVVYKGTGNSVTVSGLYLGTTYHVALYEYAGTVNTAGVNLGTNYRQHDAQKTSGTISTPPGDYTYTFSYTGSPQQVYIPTVATNIQFTLSGGGGGGGRYEDYQDQTPGDDGHLVLASGTLTDVILTVYVGGGGAKAPATATGGAGGWGYPSGQSGFPGDNSSGGAGGGGASALYSGTTRLAEAAGGKGGRSDDWEWNGDSGVGGAGGAGGGSSFGDTINTSGGGTGGLAPNYGTPTDGGHGQVIITFSIP